MFIRNIFILLFSLVLSGCAMKTTSKSEHVEGLETLALFPTTDTNQYGFDEYTELTLGSGYHNNKLEYSRVALYRVKNKDDEFKIVKRRDRPTGSGSDIAIAQSIYTYQVTAAGMQLIEHKATQTSLIGSFEIPILTRSEIEKILNAASLLGRSDWKKVGNVSTTPLYVNESKKVGHVSVQSVNLEGILENMPSKANVIQVDIVNACRNSKLHEKTFIKLNGKMYSATADCHQSNLKLYLSDTVSRELSELDIAASKAVLVYNKKNYTFSSIGYNNAIAHH